MLLLFGWAAGQVALPVATETITFKDVTRQAGIDFVHHSSPNKRYIVESMGGGVALWDYDGDGWLDIYLLNSNTVDGVLANRPSPPAGLYRNKRNGTFEEVAARAGLANPGWAMGVSVADYDNDGHDDLYVTCFGPNRLYRNRGDGTFEDVTTKAGVGDPRFSTGSAWADYDRDGDLDLFVSNYVDFKSNDLPEFGKGKLCQYKGVPVQCGPRGLPGAGDALYRNNGDGTFGAPLQRRPRPAGSFPAGKQPVPENIATAANPLSVRLPAQIRQAHVPVRCQTAEPARAAGAILPVHRETPPAVRRCPRLRDAAIGAALNQNHTKRPDPPAMLPAPDRECLPLPCRGPTQPVTIRATASLEHARATPPGIP